MRTAAAPYNNVVNNPVIFEKTELGSVTDMARARATVIPKEATPTKIVIGIP